MLTLLIWTFDRLLELLQSSMLLVNQLHCLNYLRMALFADYYHSAEDLTHPEYMPHLMHALT